MPEHERLNSADNNEKKTNVKLLIIFVRTKKYSNSVNSCIQEKFYPTRVYVLQIWCRNESNEFLFIYLFSFSSSILMQSMIKKSARMTFIRMELSIKC